MSDCNLHWNCGASFHAPQNKSDKGDKNYRDNPSLAAPPPGGGAALNSKIL
jgi:hypothetical protein